MSSEKKSPLLSPPSKCLDCKNPSAPLYKLFCSHEFCEKCLHKIFKSQIESNENPFHCPIPDCGKRVANFIVEGLFSDKKLSHFKNMDCTKCGRSFCPIKFECGHTNCPKCLKRTIKSNLKKNLPIKCPALECERTYTEENLQDLGLREIYITKFKRISENCGNSLIKSQIQSEIRKNLPENEIIEVKENLEEKKRLDILKGKRQCGICLDYFSLKKFLTLTCNHKFCQKCLIMDWKNKISANQQILCPDENCGKEINYYTIKDNLPEKDFQKYDEKITERAINEGALKNEKTINCPLKCNTKCIIWKDASYFTCPSCKKTFCAQENCLGEWNLHEKLSCIAYKKMYNKQNLYNENSFENYIKEKKFMRCPKCNSVIEKLKNCNYIRCESQVCAKKTVFCYLCGELLKEKKLNEHFIMNSPYSNCKNFENRKEGDNNPLEEVKEEEEKKKLKKEKCENEPEKIKNQEKPPKNLEKKEKEIEKQKNVEVTSKNNNNNFEYHEKKREIIETQKKDAFLIDPQNRREVSKKDLSSEKKPITPKKNSYEKTIQKQEKGEEEKQGKNIFDSIEKNDKNVRTNGISKDSTEFQNNSCINNFGEQKSDLDGNYFEKKNAIINTDNKKIANAKNDSKIKFPLKKNENVKKEKETNKAIDQKNIAQAPVRKPENKNIENCEHLELKKNVKEGVYYCKECNRIFCYNCRKAFPDKNHLIKCKNIENAKEGEASFSKIISRIFGCSKHK